jgi:hypothetical protein
VAAGARPELDFEPLAAFEAELPATEAAEEAPEAAEDAPLPAAPVAEEAAEPADCKD